MESAHGPLPAAPSGTPGRRLVAGIRLGLAAGAVIAVAGCATTQGITSTGTVDDTTWVASAPVLFAVAPDPDAGFTPAQPNAAAAPARPVPVAAVRVIEAVPLGTRVSAGDVVARLDPVQQEAALAAARADADLAQRRVDLVAAQLETVMDNRADARAQRADLVKAIDEMTSGRAEAIAKRRDLKAKQTDLKLKLADLRAKRADLAGNSAELDARLGELRATVADLEARLQQLQQALQATPDDQQLAAELAQVTTALGQATAGVAQLEPAAAKARAGLDKLDAGLAEATAGARKLTEGLGQLADGIRKLDTNLAKARDGLVKLDDALSQLDDAAAQLDDAGQLARIDVQAKQLAVDRAGRQHDLTVVAAPGDGIVVGTSTAGGVVRPGAPTVTIRPDADATVTTWLPPDAADRICPGGPVTVGTDWNSHRDATVTRIGTDATFPPTSQGTTEVHLTRAVRVTVTLAGADPLPPGSPVDLTFTACKEN